MPIAKVYLELTNSCNLNCVMCYRNAWQFETQDMSKDVLDQCIQQISETVSIKEVVLGGIGEPTYAGDAQRVMHALEDKYLTLTTNGTIMHPSMVETIVDCVDHMVLSIDGMHDVFYSMRQYPLARIIENMKAFNKQKAKKGSKTPALSLQMVITTTNQDQMMQIIDLAVSLQASQVIFSNILPTHSDDEALVLYKRYENSAMQKHVQRVQNYAFCRGMEVKFPASQLKTERRCRFIEDHTLTITATGDVTPCYRFAHDGSEVVFGRNKEVIAKSFGHIGKQTLQEIWQDPSYEAFRATVYN
ncbi:MAG: radical SAM protein, partial [Firmicutes bacterium]|nr:radical SAM protein [Bacillota bacterium]